MAHEIETITQQLTALVREKTGDPSATVAGLSALPGHAGVSYSFDLTARGGVEHLVVRLAPEGVPIAGPTDVVRQARIMVSLAGTAVPVPPIKWYDNDPRWFGRPFFVVGFVAGDKLALGERTYEAGETRIMVGAAVGLGRAILAGGRDETARQSARPPHSRPEGRRSRAAVARAVAAKPASA